MTPWIMRQLRQAAAMRAPDAGGTQAEEAAAESAVATETQAAARQREESLLRREADVTRRELRAQALEALAARQMPAELAELIDCTDADRCASSLGRVQMIWQQAVQRGVESRVAGSVPKAGNGAGSARGTMRDAISAYYNR